MTEYIILAIFIYFSYQFIFKLVLPLLRATSLMKQRVNQMNAARQQYEGQANTQQGNNAQSHATTVKPPRETAKEKEGEYIDFEDIK